MTTLKKNILSTLKAVTSRPSTTPDRKKPNISAKLITIASRKEFMTQTSSTRWDDLLPKSQQPRPLRERRNYPKGKMPARNPRYPHTTSSRQHSLIPPTIRSPPLQQTPIEFREPWIVGLAGQIRDDLPEIGGDRLGRLRHGSASVWSHLL